jgi:uncharacterized membrane protein YdjX (TVP38/TMEM64 family)
MSQTSPTPARPQAPTTAIRWWLGFACIVLLLAWLAPAGHHLNPDFAVWQQWQETLRELISRHWLPAVVLVFLLHTLLAAMGLPGASLLMFAAGSGFGAALGTLLCLTGCTAGATLAMLASRRWLQPWVRRRHGARLAELEARIATDGASWLFSLRLLPVVPFTVVNLAAGLTPMRAWTFTWVSFAGMAAGTFVYVNAGSELGHVRQLADLHSPSMLASLAALALLPWLLKPLLRRLQLSTQR